MTVENVELDPGVRDAIQEIVADILEVDEDQVGWNTHFWNELGADSMQAIAILSALERRFRITIDQSELPKMWDVQSTYQVVMAIRKAAGSDAS
jgi:acyl carrier protein